MTMSSGGTVVVMLVCANGGDGGDGWKVRSRSCGISLVVVEEELGY